VTAKGYELVRKWISMQEVKKNTAAFKVRSIDGDEEG